jgi:acyl carrier protein
MSLESVRDYIDIRKDLLGRVKKIIIEKLNLNLKVQEIDDDSPLFGMGLGLDSIDSLDLVIGIEGEFGFKVLEEDLNVFRSVNSLVDYIISCKQDNNIF